MFLGFFNVGFPFFVRCDYCGAYECLNGAARCALAVVVSFEVDSLLFAYVFEGVYAFGCPSVEESLSVGSVFGLFGSVC